MPTLVSQTATAVAALLLTAVLCSSTLGPASSAVSPNSNELVAERSAFAELRSVKARATKLHQAVNAVNRPRVGKFATAGLADALLERQVDGMLIRPATTRCRIFVEKHNQYICEVKVNYAGVKIDLFTYWRERGSSGFRAYAAHN